MNFEPAFPWEEKSHDGTTYQQFSGMQLRDYFAAKAVQGVIAGSLADGSSAGEDFGEVVAEVSYKVADAMMKERSKPRNNH